MIRPQHFLIDSRDRRDSSPKQVFKTEKTPSAQSLEVGCTDSGGVQWPIKQFMFFVIKKRSTSLFTNGESTASRKSKEDAGGDCCSDGSYHLPARFFPAGLLCRHIPPESCSWSRFSLGENQTVFTSAVVAAVGCSGFTFRSPFYSGSRDATKPDLRRECTHIHTHITHVYTHVYVWCICTHRY